MIQVVCISDARARFSELLRQVERGAVQRRLREFCGFEGT